MELFKTSQVLAPWHFLPTRPHYRQPQKASRSPKAWSNEFGRWISRYFELTASLMALLHLKHDGQHGFSGFIAVSLLGCQLAELPLIYLEVIGNSSSSRKGLKQELSSKICRCIHRGQRSFETMHMDFLALLLTMMMACFGTNCALHYAGAASYPTCSMEGQCNSTHEL